MHLLSHKQGRCKSVPFLISPHKGTRDGTLGGEGKEDVNTI